jgi:hypothetical protein
MHGQLSSETSILMFEKIYVVYMKPYIFREHSVNKQLSDELRKEIQDKFKTHRNDNLQKLSDALLQLINGVSWCWYV